jgi:hypothetical protein
MLTRAFQPHLDTPLSNTLLPAAHGVLAPTHFRVSS